MRTHHLFISHSWNYSSQYKNLMSLLRQRPYFSFKDFSVPRDDPIHDAGTSAELRRAIRAKMSPCGVVLILAGVYASYSKWINEEIDLARRDFLQPKPVIAIKPYGSTRMSVRVQEAADRIVGWNTESVVSAIRELS